MRNFGTPAERASPLFWITQRRSFMSERCSLSSSCSTGVMPREASVDTSPVRHTFLKFVAPNSRRLWTYDALILCRETRPIRRAGRRGSAFLLTDERPETVWKVRRLSHDAHVRHRPPLHRWSRSDLTKHEPTPEEIRRAAERTAAVLSCLAFAQRGAQQLLLDRLPPGRPCDRSDPPARAQDRLSCRLRLTPVLLISSRSPSSVQQFWFGHRLRDLRAALGAFIGEVNLRHAPMWCGVPDVHRHALTAWADHEGWFAVVMVDIGWHVGSPTRHSVVVPNPKTDGAPKRLIER